MSELIHATIAVNGVNLHVVQAGPTDGKLVIMLHGFPEFWYSWRNQINFLADLGYRVWVPDQRGYNLSDKPVGIANYSLSKLVGDVTGLIEAAGEQKAIVIAHDWGAIVAWWLATTQPKWIEKLVILNVPHPSLALRIIKRSPSQLLRSWYILFFQIPRLPEWLLSRKNNDFLVRTVVGTARHKRFSRAEVEEYKRAWAQPGAVAGMINYYRALVRVERPTPPPNLKIEVPVQIIWGVKDIALSRAGAEVSLEICQDGRLTFIEEATHWVQGDEPDRVNTLLKNFLLDHNDHHQHS